MIREKIYNWHYTIIILSLYPCTWV